MSEAQLKAVVSTDHPGPVLTPQVAALGIDCIEGAAQPATVPQLGLAAFVTPPSEGVVGQQLRRSREGPVGNAQAIEHHAGHGFARRHPCLSIWHKRPVKHGDQPSVLNDSSHHAYVIETLDAHLFHGTTLP
jgi:hypothetical protein